MNKLQKILSPCISICKSDPSTGYCYGCARSNNEKKIWKNPDTTNQIYLNMDMKGHILYPDP